MRIELIIIIVTGLIIANVYTDGKYLKVALSWKKYYQMIGIAFAGLALCWLMRKNPARAMDILHSSNEYVKYLPVDKNVSSFISPILNFTRDPTPGGASTREIGGGHPEVMPQYRERLFKSGTKSTKRSVSETKKKFVAARQNWCCGDCKKQLSAWFEVDHTIRLEHGGSNHIDNLVALCRECHGKKTAMENL